MGTDTTTSPILQLAVFSPSSTTSPQNSWPMTTSRPRSMISMPGKRVTGESAGLVRHLDHLVAVLQGVQVGSADAARQRLDQNLARTGSRVDDVVDDQFSSSHHGCSHRGFSSRVVRAKVVESRPCSGTGKRPWAEPRSSGGSRSSMASATRSWSESPSWPTTSKPSPGRCWSTRAASVRSAT